MGLNADLDIAIKAVCPEISGVSIGDRYDRSTWIIRFLPEANPIRRLAAEQVLATFPLPTGPDEPVDPWAAVNARLAYLEAEIVKKKDK